MSSSAADLSANTAQKELEQIASQVIDLAREGGATDSECTIAEGDEFSVNVRLGELENLKEAGSRGVGLRVLIGHRAGSAYTSDLTPAGIRQMVDSAIELAGIAMEDPYSGLAEPEEFGRLDTDLALYDDNIALLTTQWKIDQALAAEAAALAFDPRVNNSEGAAFDSYTGLRVFANSRGFLGSYRSSSCSLSATPVARQGPSLERDYWVTSGRSAAGLESPEYVGRKAAERVLRRLGPHKIATRKAPVIFEARVARSLLDHIFDAVNGSSVYRKASFLAGKLGRKIASERVTTIDDATIPRLFGTSPFDDEGIASRRTVVIEKGVLTSYLLNTYTARRLQLKTTGNAARGLTGNAGVGHGNFYLEPGKQSAEDLIRAVGTCLYVTELIGHGVNTVTGDYSRGAVGIWMERGEPAYPVAEVTIASTLQEMLMGIEMIGSDLEFRSSLSSPTLVIREMTISGQ